MPTHISAADLRKVNACADQLRKFIELFAEEPVEVTEETCAAVADKFDFSWAGEHLLRGEARAEFERRRLPMRDAYVWQEAPLRSEFVRQSAVLRAKHARQEAAWVEYTRQRAQLWAEFERQKAQLFARCYRSMP